MSLNKKFFLFISVLIIFSFFGLSAFFRFAFLYNFLPLFCMAGILFLFAEKARLWNFVFWSIIVMSFILHSYHLMAFPFWPGGDSKDYLMYGLEFAKGEGLKNLIYWPPLYPFFVGLCLKINNGSIFFILLIQHLLLWLGNFILWDIGKKLDFSKTACLLSLLFFSVNSICMQMAQTIMTESVYLFMILVCIRALIEFVNNPEYKNGIIFALSFALASLTRQLLNPLFFLILVIQVIFKRKRIFLQICLVLFIFFALQLPWSIRNQIKFGHFGLNANLGLVLFTKLTTYKLQDSEAGYFRVIREPFDNVLKDLRLQNYKTPEVPQDDWQINKIPHALSDSLVKYHGYTFSQANNLLTHISIKGFFSAPFGYFKTILWDFSELLMKHHEIFPNPEKIFPLPKSLKYKIPFLYRFIRGMVYIPGWSIILVVLLLFIKGSKVRNAIPLIVLLYGFGIISCIQVGFTRYSVPWLPFLCICCAFAMIRCVEFFSRVIFAFIESISGK